MAPELPSLADELERKTIETLQWICEMYRTRQMSDSELRVAVQTVFNMASGLVSSETMELVTLANADASAKTTLRRVFMVASCPEKYYVVSWQVGASEVCVWTEKGKKVYACLHAADAEGRFRGLCEKLMSNPQLLELT